MERPFYLVMNYCGKIDRPECKSSIIIIMEEDPNNNGMIEKVYKI